MLFLFYFCLLYDVKFTYCRSTYNLINYVPIGSFLGLFFFIELLYMLNSDLGSIPVNLIDSSMYSDTWVSELNSKSNLNLIAEVLYITIFIFYDLRG